MKRYVEFQGWIEGNPARPMVDILIAEVEAVEELHPHVSIIHFKSGQERRVVGPRNEVSEKLWPQPVATDKPHVYPRSA